MRKRVRKEKSLESCQYQWKLEIWTNKIIYLAKEYFSAKEMEGCALCKIQNGPLWLTCVPTQGPQKDDFELPACMKIAETVAIVGL